MIRSTSTVMIATVIIRFVAILHAVLAGLLTKLVKWDEVPTRHTPQCFHAPVDISFALQYRQSRVLYLFSL